MPAQRGQGAIALQAKVGGYRIWQRVHEHTLLAVPRRRNEMNYPTNEEIRHAAQRALDWPKEDCCANKYFDRNGDP